VNAEQLQARIRELEAQLNAAIVGADELVQAAGIDTERRAKLWATAKHWQGRAEKAEARLDAVPVDELRRWFEHSSVGAAVDAMRYDRDTAWMDHDAIKDWLSDEAQDGAQ
jgi:Holliday junction resolvase-like predicted endonuclease